MRKYFSKMHDKVVSETSLKNITKSEKSAYFHHALANNFFLCIFKKLYQRIQNSKRVNA
jgi:hypothetical protein